MRSVFAKGGVATVADIGNDVLRNLQHSGIERIVPAQKRFQCNVKIRRFGIQPSQPIPAHARNRKLAVVVRARSARDGDAGRRRRYPADVRATLGKFFLDPLIAAVDMINPVNRGFAFGHQAGEH